MSGEPALGFSYSFALVLDIEYAYRILSSGSNYGTFLNLLARRGGPAKAGVFLDVPLINRCTTMSL
jgi:hypothetical protein